MLDQLTRLKNHILDLLGIGYHERRAVKPSRFVDCSSCDRQALINNDTPPPWLCENCKAAGKK